MNELKPLPHEIKTFKQIVEYDGMTYLIETTVNFIKTVHGFEPHVKHCYVDEIYIDYAEGWT